MQENPDWNDAVPPGPAVGHPLYGELYLIGATCDAWLGSAGLAVGV